MTTIYREKSLQIALKKNQTAVKWAVNLKLKDRDKKAVI